MKTVHRLENGVKAAMSVNRSRLEEETLDFGEWLILEPSDLHHHFRDGELMESIVGMVANQFSRALAMPNLVPPVVNVGQAMEYKKRLMNALDKSSYEENSNSFEPLMTLYLTDNTSPQDIVEAKAEGVVACKLYPAGATTNSDSGVTDIKKVYPTLRAMEECGILLLIHGEVVDSDIDIFDREHEFIERHLKNLVRDFPNLKIVMEHITTKEAVQFVSGCNENVAATVTCHHLLLNRAALFEGGGIRPHHYCLPVLKAEEHRQALLRAVTSGNPKFFLGTDSAPHTKNTKECCKGKAGCFTAANALEFYAEAFHSMKKMEKLSAFASVFGPAFYGLPIPPLFKGEKYYRKLTKVPTSVPDTFPFGGESVVPLRHGENVNWTLQLEKWTMDEPTKSTLKVSQSIWQDNGGLLSLPISEARAKWNQYALQLSKPVNSSPDLLKVIDAMAGRTPVRIYLTRESPFDSRKSPVILFVHGGGLCFGNLETHDSICRLLSYESKCPVVAVDYRLAPENKYPAAFDDVYNTVQWVQDNASNNHYFPDGIDPHRVVLAGESSGGAIVTSVCQKWTKDKKSLRIALQVLWYPSVGLDVKDDANILSIPPAAETKRMGLLKQYLPTDSAEYLSNPYIQPMNFTVDDLRDVPPAYLCVPGFDPLCDIMIAYGRKLHAAAVPTTIHLKKSTIHGFLYMSSLIPESIAAIRESASFITHAFLH